MKFCENCGKQLLADSKFCHFCGAEVATNVENQMLVKTRSKSVLLKKLLVVFAVVLAVLAVLGFVIGKAISQNNYEKTLEFAYKEKLESAYKEITYSAGMAETYATLESKVWWNCIYEKSSTETDKYTKDENGRYYSDFNDALSNFYDGEDSTFWAVYDSVTLVDEYILELKDYPEKYKDEYSAIKELYIAYSDLTDLVIGTSSYSFNTFDEALKNAKSNYKKALHSAKLILE